MPRLGDCVLQIMNHVGDMDGGRGHAACMRTGVFSAAQPDSSCTFHLVGAAKKGGGHSATDIKGTDVREEFFISKE
jgi:hypothetical protein